MDYNIKLGAQIDENSIVKIKSDLDTKLQDKKINIRIDSKELEQIKDLLNNIYLELGRLESKNGFSSATKGAKNFNKELERTTRHIKNQTFATDNWVYNWSKAMQSFLTYNTVTQFFNTVSNGIKDMIRQVKELDDALTEFKKVSDLSGESLERYIDKAYKMGEVVAKTGTEMIEAATSFKKSGYTDEMSLELGTIAAMYTNIADEAISSADAADMIIAQMKAFKIEAQDAIHIIDAINEVSNNYAVSSADIAMNLGKASSVMANAGNSLEQMIGLMTAGTEITRNGSKVANGLKTLTLRLQGMNDEGEKDLELQAQMEELFKKLGISVYNANGELKNTYEILETLAPIYKELTNAEKAYVTETIAGKYQAQNAAAILSNWQTAVNATTTALNSNGSAARENAKVLDSIQGHLQKLNSAWEQLSKNLFNSNLLKLIIDIGTAFLNAANSGIGQFIIKTTLLVVAFNLLKSSFTAVTFKTIKMTAAQIALSTSTKKVTAEMIKEKAASLTLGQSFDLLKEKALASIAAMATNPLTWIAGAIVGLVAVVNYIDKADERAEEAYQKAQDEYSTAKDNVAQTNSKLEETQNRIDELNSKDKLTFTEQDELDNLKATNAELKAILENQKEIEKDKKNKASDKYLEQESEKKYISSNWGTEGGESGFASIWSYTKDFKNMKEYLKYIQKWYKYAKEENEKAIKETGKADETWNETYKKYGEILRYYENYYSEQMKKLSGKAYKDAKEKRDAILKILNPGQYKKVKLEEVFSSKKFTSAKKELDELSKSGDINKETVDELRKKYSEFDEALKKAGLSSEDVADSIIETTNEQKEAASNIESLAKTFENSMGKIANKYSYITSAAEEFNENGYITLDTFKNLMDNNLWQYLDWTANGLDANTNALINEADAAKYNALISLKDAFAKDALAIATGDLAEISPIAEAALAGLSGEIENAGLIASAKAGNLFNLAGAIDTVNEAAKGKGLKNIDAAAKAADLQKLVNSYNNAAAGIANVNYQASAKKSGSGSGKGSSSKSEKEWWEKAYDDLKAQFDYSDITIEQYISGLENLLGKLDKGSDAWKKINKELQKAKLDKVKDDYNAGRISLNQYIISLQNLQQAYKEGTNAWNDLSDAIKKAKIDQLKEQQNDLKAALSAVNNVLEKQINEYEDLKQSADDRYNDELDKLNELQDSLNDSNDDYERAQKAVVKFLNEQLDSINSQKDSIEDYYDNVIDSIEKMNEDTQESIELAEAYEALINAMTQKTKKVWKEGLGWTWTADQKAIEDAKKTYDDLVKNATTKEIEKQKDKTIKSLEEQISSLQEYIDSWDKVFDKFDNEKNTNLANLLLGDNWTEMVSQLDPQVVEDFSNAYYDLQKNLEETEKQIEILNKQKEEEDKYWNNLIDDLENYKDKWSDIANAYTDAQDALKAKQIIGANWEKEILDKRLDVLENFKNKYNAILAEIDKVGNMSTAQAAGYTALKLPGYANGGEVNYTGLAVLHGTPNKPEYVLNNTQMRNLLGNLTKPRFTSVNNNGNSSNVYNYNFGNIELPNVNNAKQFINELKSLVNTSKNL